LSNPILGLISALSAICGLVVINFLFIVFISVKRLGGSLEKRHVIVISSVALLFFLASVILGYLGSITA